MSRSTAACLSKAKNSASVRVEWPIVKIVGIAWDCRTGFVIIYIMYIKYIGKYIGVRARILLRLEIRPLWSISRDLSCLSVRSGWPLIARDRKKAPRALYRADIGRDTADGDDAIANRTGEPGRAGAHSVGLSGCLVYMNFSPKTTPKCR